MGKILINNTLYEKSFLLTTEEGQSILRENKSADSRPACMCRETSPEMYISRRGSLFYLARMPGTAIEHAETCLSHIIDECALSANSALTADQLLHQLWSDVIRSLVGNTGWPHIRNLLEQSVGQIMLDGKELSDHLLIPITFNKSRIEEITRIHLQFFKRQQDDPDKQVRYWAVGFLKEVHERQFNFQITIKHLPTIKFWIHKEAGKAIPAYALTREDRFVLGLFSCRSIRSGIEIDEAATLVLDAQLRPVLNDILQVTPEKLQRTRALLGLNDMATEAEVFSLLVNRFLISRSSVK